MIARSRTRPGVPSASRIGAGGSPARSAHSACAAAERDARIGVADDGLRERRAERDGQRDGRERDAARRNAGSGSASAVAEIDPIPVRAARHRGRPWSRARARGARSSAIDRARARPSRAPRGDVLGRDVVGQIAARDMIRELARDRAGRARGGDRGAAIGSGRRRVASGSSSSTRSSVAGAAAIAASWVAAVRGGERRLDDRGPASTPWRAASSSRRARSRLHRGDPGGADRDDVHPGHGSIVRAIAEFFEFMGEKN